MTKSALNIALTHLKSTQIFNTAEESLLASAVTKYGSQAVYKRGDTVFERGSPLRALCIILKGEARVSKGDTVISRLGAGDIYGAAYLYNPARHFENTVVAVTPLRVLIIPKEGVDEIIRGDSRTAFNFIAYLSERVSFLNSKIESYTQPTAEERLLLYLRSNCEQGSGKCEIAVSMTELSGVLHISRASLYRVLDNLQQEGKIIKNGKKIYLKAEKSDESD